MLATVAKQQSHGSLSDFAWRHIATIFPCESTRSCRLLHMTSRAEKAANDYKTKQVKNLEFVKRWNIENGALYGPKLRGHKKLAKQNKGVLLMSNDEIPISLNEPAFFEIPMPTEQRKDTTELKVSNTPKVKPVPKPKAGPKPDSVPRPALFVSGDTNELDWILKFPMFSSGKDALLQMMPGSPSEQLSSVSALEGQPVARVSRILEDTKSDHSKFMLARWLTKMVEEMGKEEFAKFQSGWFMTLNITVSRLESLPPLIFLQVLLYDALGRCLNLNLDKLLCYRRFFQLHVILTVFCTWNMAF